MEPAADRPASRGDRGATLIICVTLAVAVFLVFGRTLRSEFVNFDDDQYFYANSQVQHGLTWGGVVWAFQTTHAANWHPLTWLSLMLDVELFETGPLGPHLTNVLLHAAGTVLLFLLLRRLTGALWRSTLVAALFGLHPLHVESVAWVSERKDVLSGLFFMLTLLMYAQYAQKRSGVEGRESRAGGGHPALVSRLGTLDYYLALIFFALGLMSKPMLVTVPFVLLLLDYWPLRRFSTQGIPSTLNLQLATWKRLLAEKLPFLALSTVSSVVTFLAQGDAVQPLDRIPMGIRAVNAMVSCVRYLGKTVWPVNLAIPYPFPRHWSFESFWLSAVLFFAAIVLAIRLGRRFPFLITGWFWYLGMLMPVIGVVQVGAQAMADRYTYLPLIGVFIALVWGTSEVLGRWRLPAGVAWCLAMLVLAGCVARTSDQLRYWKNSETLCRHAAAVTQGNYIAYNNLGEYCFRQGRTDEAIDNYRKAIRIQPGYDDALNNLGVALAQKGDLDEALVRIREAIHYRPDRADTCYNLGNVFLMQRKLDEAINAYNDALRLKPDYPEAHNNLANILVMQGHPDEAIRHYQEALRLNPNHEGAKRQLRALGVPTP